MSCLPPQIETTPDLADAGERYLRALLDRNSARARAVVEQALAAGAAPAALIRSVIEPALVRIGVLWELAEINVAHEHYATVVSHSVLANLAVHMRTAPKDGRLALVAATPGEQHALGPQVVADFLEADGWEALCLGADVPARDLAVVAAEERVDLVALSTTTPTQMRGAIEAIELLALLEPRPLVAVGGQGWDRAAEALARDAGADVIAADPETLVAVARERCPPPGD